MTAWFEDKIVDRDGRLSFGVERATGGFYLSISVSNARADYEEYFRLDGEEYDRLRSDLSEARTFADLCRTRRKDDRLILQPGSDRGEPR